MASTPIATRRPTAVVCTAVEGFRPRRAADAAQTLTLLERDRQLLRALAAQHDGTVLQTFESGLLLAFASAEQAVLYAIASQTALAQAGAQVSPRDRLDHRLGIHLENVGDRSVATATSDPLVVRLQRLAAPGGICLSQAAYQAVKHHLKLNVTDLGLHSLATAAEPSAVYAIAPPARPMIRANVLVTYRTREPDSILANQLYQALTEARYRAFMASDDLYGDPGWVSWLEQKLRGCDYLLFLLSEQALRSEMVAEEWRRAQELQAQHPAGKPLLLPIWAGSATDVARRAPWQDYLEQEPPCVWRSPAETPTLIATVLDLLAGGLMASPVRMGEIMPRQTPAPAATALPLPAAIPELPEGQVEVGSDFYIERPPLEARARETILRPGALIRIKAPRQMGKTSLLAQTLHYARQQGCDSLSLSFQLAERSLFRDLDRFLQWFCASIGRRLGLPNRLREFWDEIFGSKDNCTAYFEEQILSSLERPLALGLDEVDCIFEHPDCAADFLGMLRAWHEDAKNRPVWQRLRLIIVHSTEVYVPMAFNQSPFNVGLPLELPEFNAAQMRELAGRHGLDWQTEVAELMQLVGGHPYLARLAMYAIARQDTTLPELLATAPTEASLYSDHLRRHFWQLRQQPRLATAMRAVVNNDQPLLLPSDQAFKLHSIGLVSLQGNQVQPRCELYRRYFRDRLL
ncbi:MAG: TIR domain-containing protein [Spirulinaceae cyanobacterium SM2_1_0]|nr:TIR domain-containing protein [Spirulinaceae cyanobacterium SM2_1_0]